MNEQREIRDLIEEYQADCGSLGRSEPNLHDELRIDAFQKLNSLWLRRAQDIDIHRLDAVGKVDWVLFSRHLDRELKSLARRRGELSALLHAVPFAGRIFALDLFRRCFEPLDAPREAQQLHEISEEVARVKSAFTDARPEVDAVALIDLVESLRPVMMQWAAFYRGYDPAFNWWMEAPLAQLSEQLEAFERFVREDVAGIGRADKDRILGRPVGREALIEDLAHEMIPYTPEELVAIGEREYLWCAERLRQASNELGFGDDWLKALDHVKSQYVEPGRQPEMVTGLAEEAIQYVKDHDLVTVPELAENTWRMAMMSPEDQKVNPFFLGGEQIIVSYATNTMSHAEKMMSMRGNCPALSRATVQHELIPGHHLQMYMADRYKPYRRLFSTPFWIEGWTINWEMVLWDMGFPRTPEERIGMLFWRIHRAARIVFSIKFHLGQMTAQECVDMLVERVGHERANAEGEVRRSFKGTYPPLYQAAYMIGGIMFRAMRRELVDTHQMTLKQFHDAVMQENDIPPVVLRSILRGDEFKREFAPHWRFDEVQG